jgi:carbonic anhydrase
MSCTTGNMPINVNPTNKTCSMTCAYKFNYGISSLNVTNKKNYILFSYDGNNDVTYNGDSYNVQECRLYTPSLNKYNNKTYDAELIIHHVNNYGMNLLVCVPIQSSNASSASQVLFSKIIPFLSAKQNEAQTININNYSLNHFVPASGYYAYKGSLPYQPCSGKYDIVLFDPKNAINMDTKSISLLKNIIKPIQSHIKEVDTNNYAYNKNGTMENELMSGDDNIYIDCTESNTIDGDGNILNTETDKSIKDKADVHMSKKTQEILEASGGIIGGIVVAIGCYYGFRYILSKIDG